VTKTQLPSKNYLVLPTMNKIFYNGSLLKNTFKYKPYVQEFTNLTSCYLNATFPIGYKIVNLFDTKFRICKIFKQKTTHNYINFNKNISTLLLIPCIQPSKSFLEKKPLKYTEVRYTKLSLVLVNTGIFFSKNVSLINNLRSNKYKYLYNLKKKIYSFLSPNQVKTSILRKKNSLILFKLLSTKNTFSSEEFEINSLFFKKILLKLPVSLFSMPSSINNNNTNRVSEIRIPRVKFKPGYQRI
jgi:hypothetical protein